MKILFTICGRAGSKGIKNKNIRDFLEKPLPYYSISAIDLFLKRANEDVQADIAINTDSPELMELMRNNGLRPVEIIERDESLAGDRVAKVDVLIDCIEKMEERMRVNYDVVVDLDITSPLRTVDDLKKVIDTFFEKKCDIVTTVVPARRNPYFNQVKRIDKGFTKVIDSNYVSRQQAPEIFDMNASIYAYRPGYLKEHRKFWDSYIECIEMYDTGILDLDHENDFELMEVMAKYLFEKNESFAEIAQNI